MWLIKSIHQRQRTIYKVMQSIIKHQREFFERGINYPQAAQPARRRRRHRDARVDGQPRHDQQVRAYAAGHLRAQVLLQLEHQPRAGRRRSASESVKERIRRLIVNEDPRRPLSDQRIAEMLRVANIDIARRTVTKYRESMNLLSSTKRRQVG
jgi:RNA polymerase sigma-54 factor